ncbi:MAG: nucleotidyltransferase domain-containing protein [bacterium]
MVYIGDNLTDTQNRALEEFGGRAREQFEIEEIYLFGSYVRGEASEESDLDVLVITSRFLERKERHLITDIAFEVNLKYGTNISTTVVYREDWEEGEISFLSISREIKREGILI